MFEGESGTPSLNPKQRGRFPTKGFWGGCLYSGVQLDVLGCIVGLHQLRGLLLLRGDWVVPLYVRAVEIAGHSVLFLGC